MRAQHVLVCTVTWSTLARFCPALRDDGVLCDGVRVNMSAKMS